MNLFTVVLLLRTCEGVRVDSLTLLKVEVKDYP
jgi:hypothetical protein